ncbi:hypothetical protein FBU30_003022 [Linnemannia zychae]|nr:hypothetical protein FBU30_003022 [Linnemannia zychae]
MASPTTPQQESTQEAIAQDIIQDSSTSESVLRRLNNLCVRMNEKKNRILNDEQTKYPVSLEAMGQSTQTTTRISYSSTQTYHQKSITPRSVDTMTKNELILALQREHPMRTLDVGTRNANVSRVVRKEFEEPAQMLIYRG